MTKHVAASAERRRVVRFHYERIVNPKFRNETAGCLFAYPRHFNDMLGATVEIVDDNAFEQNCARIAIELTHHQFAVGQKFEFYTRRSPVHVEMITECEIGISVFKGLQRRPVAHSALRVAVE